MPANAPGAYNQRGNPQRGRGYGRGASFGNFRGRGSVSATPIHSAFTSTQFDGLTEPSNGNDMAFDDITETLFTEAKSADCVKNGDTDLKTLNARITELMDIVKKKNMAVTAQDGTTTTSASNAQNTAAASNAQNSDEPGETEQNMVTPTNTEFYTECDNDMFDDAALFDGEIEFDSPQQAVCTDTICSAAPPQASTEITASSSTSTETCTKEPFTSQVRSGLSENRGMRRQVACVMAPEFTDYVNLADKTQAKIAKFLKLTIMKENLPDQKLLRDPCFENKLLAPITVLRRLQIMEPFGPQMGYRTTDGKDMFETISDFAVDKLPTVDYFYTVFLAGDSTSVALKLELQRRAEIENMKILVNSTGSIYSGQRLPCIGTALKYNDMRKSYDAVILRAVLDSADLELCTARRTAGVSVRNNFLVPIENLMNQILAKEAFSLQPHGRFILSLIGPTLPDFDYSIWSEELAAEIFYFFLDLEQQLIGFLKNRHPRVMILPVMSFCLTQYADMGLGSPVEAMTNMISRDGLHTSKTGVKVIGHLVIQTLKSMSVCTSYRLNFQNLNRIQITKRK